MQRRTPQHRRPNLPKASRQKLPLHPPARHAVAPLRRKPLPQQRAR